MSDFKKNLESLVGFGGHDDEGLISRKLQVVLLSANAEGSGGYDCIVRLCDIHITVRAQVWGTRAGGPSLCLWWRPISFESM